METPFENINPDVANYTTNYRGSEHEICLELVHNAIVLTVSSFEDCTLTQWRV